MKNKIKLDVLRGLVVALLISANTLLWPVVLMIAAFFRLLPWRPWHNWWNEFMHKIPVYWTDINKVIMGCLLKTQWEIEGLNDIKKDDWYLLISNHQAWTDILVLQMVFNRKIPIIKFFMKKQLLWSLPLAGWACWLLDYPFMERYSKEFIAKHPELKGKDLETTRKACEKFKHTPTAVLSFVEGTRFTVEKHQRQDSPYQHLLRPRAGGIAFTMSAMGEYFHKVLDVTIVYSHFKPNLWNFFCGRINKIVVNVATFPVTADLIGDYENDRTYRSQFQAWLNSIWQHKDQLITTTLLEKASVIISSPLVEES